MDDMNDRTAQLRQRRTAMQRRLARQREAATFRQIAQRLDRCCRISRIPAARVAELVKDYATLPLRDERFFWPDIAAHMSVGFETDAERDRSFRHALSSSFSMDDRLACIFHTADSALSIRCSDLMQYAPSILDPLHDLIWVINPLEAGSLVEVSLIDREVCWLL